MNAALFLLSAAAFPGQAPAAAPTPAIVQVSGCDNCATGISACCSDPNPNAPGLFSRLKNRLNALRPSNLLGGLGNAGGCDGCGVVAAPTCDSCGGAWDASSPGLLARLKDRLSILRPKNWFGGLGGNDCGCGYGPTVSCASPCGGGCGAAVGGCALPPVPGAAVTPPATAPKEMPKPTEKPKEEPKKTDDKKIDVPTIPGLTPAVQAPTLGGAKSSF